MLARVASHRDDGALPNASGGIGSDGICEADSGSFKSFDGSVVTGGCRP